jgi:hypothetical protein
VETESLLKKRLAICEECPSKRRKFITDICGECGCILQIKAAIKQFNCPLNKWPKEETDK